jgi:hypothetical protein
MIVLKEMGSSTIKQPMSLVEWKVARAMLVKKKKKKLI